MRVLIDTPIWSLALCRRRQALGSADVQLVAEWTELVRGGTAALLGMVRQELLSGIGAPEQYERLRLELREFGDEAVTSEDHEIAAACYNSCRSHGVQGSVVDLLICAVAIRLRVPIFTTDADFIAYARHLPITLHQPR